MIKIKPRDSEYGMCYSCDASAYNHKTKLYDVIATSDETGYGHVMGYLCLDCLNKLSKEIGFNNLKELGLGVRA